VKLLFEGLNHPRKTRHEQQGHSILQVLKLCKLSFHQPAPPNRKPRQRWCVFLLAGGAVLTRSLTVQSSKGYRRRSFPPSGVALQNARSPEIDPPECPGEECQITNDGSDTDDNSTSCDPILHRSPADDSPTPTIAPAPMAPAAVSPAAMPPTMMMTPAAVMAPAVPSHGRRRCDGRASRESRDCERRGRRRDSISADPGRRAPMLRWPGISVVRLECRERLPETVQRSPNRRHLRPWEKMSSRDKGGENCSM
jgi:hypothetical protein